MRGSSVRRRWVEEESPPPVDLRLVPAALAVWAGALVGLLAGQIAWWGLGVAAAAAMGLLTRRPRWWAGAVVALGCFGASVAISGLHVWQQADDPLSAAAARGSWVVVQAEVAGFPRAVDSGFLSPDHGSGSEQVDVSRWRVDVVVEQAQAAGQSWSSSARLTIYGKTVAWSGLVPGERITARGRSAEQNFGAAPGVLLHARDPPTLLATAPWWSSIARGVRQDLLNNASHLEGDAAGLLPGLVVGDTSGISERLDADGKATSIAHLLAVSGSHFAILCGVAVVVLRRMGPRTAAAGGLLTLVSLVILVGPQPSVLRAAVMGAIAMLALLVGRNRTAVPALAAAVIVLLFVDPTLAVNIGFTLSVLATGGLILIAPIWSQALQKRGFPRGWADLLAIPAAAQLVTMPVIVLISGSVSVVGVIANILVAPVVAPALILGMMCALTGPWWQWTAGGFASMAEPLLLWIAHIAHTLARWPAATVPWPATPTGAVVMAALSVAAVLLLRHRRFRELLAAVAAGIALVAVPTRVLAPGWPVAGWFLTACEVGQGDAMVLSTGDPGTAVVIDAGPDPGVIDDCLDRLGIGTVPLLLLTHLHADHVDGVPGVLQGRTVGAIAVGPGRQPESAWNDVRWHAADRGIPLVELHPGMQWASGELLLSVLGPRAAFQGTESDPNNDSLVVMANRDGHRALMTGDIEIEAQQALLNAGVDLQAQVLKVPHHGSAKLLERFVAAVSPTVAVIGVGADNDYGHPSPRALELLTRSGVRTVLRTDLQGDVSVGGIGDELAVTARGPTVRVP
jgi:competence protein ComEC